MGSDAFRSKGQVQFTILKMGGSNVTPACALSQSSDVLGSIQSMSDSDAVAKQHYHYRHRSTTLTTVSLTSQTCLRYLMVPICLVPFHFTPDLAVRFLFFSFLRPGSSATPFNPSRRRRSPSMVRLLSSRAFAFRHHRHPSTQNRSQ